jgi:hypothetical protein
MCKQPFSPTTHGKDSAICLKKANNGASGDDESRSIGYNAGLRRHQRASQFLPNGVQTKATLMKDFRRDLFFFPKNS